MFLDISGLSKNFGGLQAVSELSFSVEKGQIVGLIGPNGSGKTTVFNLITGVHKPSSGKVIFQGKDLTGKPPHVVARNGIGRTFQITAMFPDFTALENVVASHYILYDSGFWHTFFNTPKYRRNEAKALERSLEVLETVGLTKYKDELAKNLPHGYQNLLGIARALAVNPQLILLDEVLSGMNPNEIIFTMEAIQKINKQGITALIIEHNMKILDICEKVVVINFGNKIAEGTPDKIRQNPEVMSAYLGSA
jgi:branched-chain amino acid transport system ATP-binding protein